MEFGREITDVDRAVIKGFHESGEGFQQCARMLNLPMKTIVEELLYLDELESGHESDRHSLINLKDKSTHVHIHKTV